MAIGTYSELLTAVGNWLHRTSATDPLTARIPEFIALAESRMNAQLKSRSMEARTTLTCVASNAYLALPTDMIEMRRLLLSSTTPQRALKYVTPDEISADYPDVTTGQPAVFTVIGANVQLAPIPDSAYSVEITYMQRIPALSVSNTTNWLLTAWPDAYLYGTLIQAGPYTKDLKDDFAVFQQQYAEAVQAINAIDWYSGSTLAVRAS